MSLGKPLGEILVEKGIITQQQLEGALAVQGEEQLGNVLVNWGWVTQEQLLEALNIQTPPPPPPPVYQQPMYQQPHGTTDLTIDGLQSSKFRVDLKTLIYVGSLLFTAVAGYFTFMGELDDRFDALEDTDNTAMVEMDKRMVELKNKFTPIGDGIYSVDPNSTWPPSRGEYKMKDEMSRTMLMQIQKDIEEIKDDIEKIESKVFGGK